MPKKRKLLWICGSLLVAGLLYWLWAKVPFRSYDLSPGPGIVFAEGRFGYKVPLDPESPWPKFRGNANQTARSSAPVRTGQERPWVYRTGKGIFSSPVLDKDGTIYIGSADQYFYALNRRGNLKWKIATGEIIDSAALLDDRGRVYFGSGDAHVYALDRATGKILWKTAAHSVEQVEKEFGIKTYNVNWFEGNIAMLPDGTIIAPNDNYLTYALNRNTGERLRVYPSNEMNWSLAAVNTKTGVMFAGSQFIALKNVYAYHGETGKSVWTSGGLGSNSASPLLTSEKENAALVLGGFDGIVRAYAQDSGKELWKFGTRDHIYGSPAQAADGAIIQASADGSIYAINADGTQRWAYDTLEPIRSSPAIDSRGVIYVGSGEGKLFAINPDGTLRWAYQCINEVRNDLNSSPAIGYEGVAIAGESGEVFFIPHDYPLTEAGRQDPRSIQGPGEILPDTGVFLVWTERFGGLKVDAPDAIDANEPLTFTLFVREKGDTVLSAFDPDQLAVAFQPESKPDSPGVRPPLIQVAANGRFISLIPQERWLPDAEGTVKVTLRGRILINHSRFGLKFYGGKTGNSFEQTFRFKLNSPHAGPMPFQIPEKSGEVASALQLSRGAAPNPTMLPSWNQIGFDSLHYLMGFVEGDQDSAILWVIPGKLNEKNGQTIVAPELKDRYVLQMEYHKGLATLYNYNKFLLSFIGSWDMPFGSYRLSTRVAPDSGRILRPAALNALVLGDDLEFYGKFLKIMGMTDFWSGHMPVYGAFNLDLWNDGKVHAPQGTGEVEFSITGRQADARIKGSSLRADKHVFGLLLVDASSGQPVQAQYARGMQIEKTESGVVARISLPLDEEVSGKNIRAYFMVDTYPAARTTLSVP